MTKMKQYTIIHIYEEDHGCEGIQSDEVLMDEILLRDADGNEKWIKLPDIEVCEKNLQEGDSLLWDEI